MTRLPLESIAGRQLKVLIIDAERVVADMFSLALSYEGACTMTAYDGVGALSAMQSFRPDLIIIDPRVPDLNGTTLLHHLARSRPHLPIILLRPKPNRPRRSARDDRRRDVLFKPFSIEEGMYRVRMAVRNNGIDPSGGQSISLVGDLLLDETDRSVWRGGDRITLTSREFDLLRFFVRNAGRALGTREILGRVWPYDYAGQPSQVRLYVSYLRRRIDDGRTPMIHTLRGIGYILKPAPGPRLPREGSPDSPESSRW